MNEDKSLFDSLCGCGLKVRYGHFKDGVEVMSCNKYAVCLSYDEQHSRIQELSKESAKYKHALEKIVSVNAMDYEYKAWAKGALKS